MHKLSDLLRARKRQCEAEVADESSAYERSRLGHVAEGLEEAALLAESYDARIAEARSRAQYLADWGSDSMYSATSIVCALDGDLS